MRATIAGVVFGVLGLAHGLGPDTIDAGGRTFGTGGSPSLTSPRSAVPLSMPASPRLGSPAFGPSARGAPHAQGIPLGHGAPSGLRVPDVTAAAPGVTVVVPPRAHRPGPIVIEPGRPPIVVAPRSHPGAIIIIPGQPFLIGSSGPRPITVVVIPGHPYGETLVGNRLPGDQPIFISPPSGRRATIITAGDPPPGPFIVAPGDNPVFVGPAAGHRAKIITP